MLINIKKLSFSCLFFVNILHPASEVRPAERVNATISCRDCDYIPKVADAGKVLEVNGKKIQVMHNGIHVFYGSYHEDWMAEIITNLKGHHEPQEEKVFHEVLKTMPSNATMIELGSFWAYYSMWFNKAIDNPINYMIEPNPNRLIISENHFTLNNMSGYFFNAFIGRESKERATFIDWDKKKYILPQVSIDDFVQSQNIEFIHILHSDIQGAEYDMLLGAKNTIKEGKIGYVFISTHGNKHQPCKNFLLESNFHIIAEHTISQSYSADGLIVARYKDYTGLNHVDISKR